MSSDHRSVLTANEECVPRGWALSDTKEECGNRGPARGYTLVARARDSPRLCRPAGQTSE